MKYELEQLNINNVIYNTYVDVESLLSHSGSSKKVVSRTKSEPVYRSKDIIKSLKDKDEMLFNKLGVSLSNDDCDRNFAPRLSPICQSPCGNGQEISVHIHPRTAKSSHNPQMPFAKQQCKVSNRNRLHRRYSSISESDLKRSRPAQMKTRANAKPSSVQKSPDGFLCYENNGSCTEAILTGAETITRQPEEHERIITQQPSLYVEKQRCSRDIRNDECYRCMGKCRDAIRCCTCVWCIDAICYHCYKDDIGFSNWSDGMLSCSETESKMKNCKKLSLLCLATMIFPCALFYPILGGSVEMCMKQRLKRK